MSKGPVHLIATIYPREGKADRVSPVLFVILILIQDYIMCIPSPANENKPVYEICIQVIELLTTMAKFVQENEPKTLKYQLHREINKKSGVDDIVMLERCVSCRPLITSLHSVLHFRIYFWGTGKVMDFLIFGGRF